MSDFQKANAAQLASRQIKSVRKRPGAGGRSTPVQASGSASFGQSQGTVNFGGGGGGLFGGGIQEPTGGSGFNFAVAGAPAAPAFNNPFQGSNAQTSGFSDNDERRDPREERPNKRVSGNGVADGDSVPLFAPQPGPFGQSSMFGSQDGQQQNGGGFSFGQNNGFNSPAAANPFAQPPASAPTINFGGASQAPSAGTPFKFGQPSPQVETANTPFKFGASATPAKPASSPFSFGQTSAQPTSTGINFGSTVATSAPATNLFGTAQPPSTNLFGFAPQQSVPGPFASLNAPAAPTSNIFGESRPASPAPSASTSNMFGNQEQASKPAPSNGLFGQQSQQATPSKPASTLFGANPAPPSSTLLGQESQQKLPSTSTLFGGSAQTQSTNTSTLFGGSAQTPTASTMFGEQKSQPTSTLFGNLSQTPSTSNMFTKPVEAPTPSNNLFGDTPKPVVSGKDLFGNLNKPVDQAVIDPKPKGASLFGSSGPRTQSTGLFGQVAPPTGLSQGNVPASTSSPSISATPSKPMFSFATTPSVPAVAAQPSDTSSLFSRIMEAPSANGPAPSGMFPSLQPAAIPEPPKNQSSPLGITSQAQVSNPATPRPIKNPSITRKAGNTESNVNTLKLARHITDETIEQFMPTRFGEEERKDFQAAYRMRMLNKAMAQYFLTLKSSADATPALELYSSERDFILSDYRVRIAKKRSSPHESDPSEASPTKRARKIDYASIQSPAPKPQAAPSAMKHSWPSAQPVISSTNGNTPTPSPAKSPLLAPPQPSIAPSPSGGKRKASNELTSENIRDVESEQKRPLRQMKTPKLSASSSRPAEESGGSNTSNIFKNILDSPSKSPQKSPTKKPASLPTTKETPSKPNPFGGLPVPKSAAMNSPAKSNPFSSLPAPKSPTKDSSAKPNPFGGLPVPPKSPVKSAPSPSASLFGAKPPSSIQFTSPSMNMFAAKPVEHAESEKSALPSSSMFGSKLAASPSNLFGSSSSTPSTSMFGAKPSEHSKTGTPKPPPSSLFGGNSATSSSSVFGSKPAASPAPPKGFSMPGFSAGGTVNFAASFAQQAEKDLQDSEKKKMEKDMDNDYDSDDDKEEWIANWKEKRRVELETLAAATKTKKGGFSLAATAKPKDVEPKTSSSTLFGSSSAAPSQSGLFSPANISRTSTPGAISSGSGSVFDGHTPGKLAPFSNNIFGHLSDSAKSDDADEESAGESDAEIDVDSENKDPNYTPQQESGSGAGTPASETGAGIASAKKSSMFSSTPSKTGSILGQSTTGTTTPRGGLFDRITRDDSGNPVRAVSTEEKENTQPNTTAATPEVKNPFASLNKSSTTPSDQTWKIDSPIKFGSATPANEAKVAPTFNFTAATPTKTSGTPGGIFGNLSSGPTSAPFSNLFGNSGASKPAAGVGFNFGGSSNTTSLFPSATTSRATSPGATTDGDSAAEDPDAEKHEQINLTAGGPGEEDEEVVFEVRAKATQYTNKEGAESAWEVKGLGPFRVLKHKETGVSRMLLRGEPRGSIVINKGILKAKYEATGKTVKLMTAKESGDGFETWIIQVKTAELAHDLAKALEANKSS